MADTRTQHDNATHTHTDTHVHACCSMVHTSTHCHSATHIVPPILNVSISGHCDTRLRSTAPCVAPKVLPVQRNPACRRCTTTSPHRQWHEETRNQNPEPVVRVHMIASKGCPHTSQCVCVVAEMDSTHGHGAQRDTHTRSVHTHTQTLSTTTAKPSNIAHCTTCTPIIMLDTTRTGNVQRLQPGPSVPKHQRAGDAGA